MISVLQIVKYSSRIAIHRSQDELMNNAVYHLACFSLLCMHRPQQISLFSISWCAHPVSLTLLIPMISLTIWLPYVHKFKMIWNIRGQ